MEVAKIQCLAEWLMLLFDFIKSPHREKLMEADNNNSVIISLIQYSPKNTTYHLQTHPQTCKGSNSPLDVISVVAFNATDMLAKEEWWSGDEDDSREGKNSEDTVPDCTFLLQENPSQKRGKDWVTEGATDNERTGLKESHKINKAK